MKDQLISFDVAKLAKEKGFNWNVKTFIMNDNYNYAFDYEKGIVADFIKQPTQSLLQKWLREEHKLSVEVYFNNGWSYDICDLETNLQNISEPYEYKTFENAFEVALMVALNMIKQDFA